MFTNMVFHLLRLVVIFVLGLLGRNMKGDRDLGKLKRDGDCQSLLPEDAYNNDSLT